jgi:MbtH protein
LFADLADGIVTAKAGDASPVPEEAAVRTTSFDFDSPEARFKVLINDEEQYSLWPADLPVPGGWTETGMCAAKDECDRYLEETWTDMRPKSLRVALDGE